MPLPRGPARVTKKRFGTYVHPGALPVSPERFTGYHAGVDFEVFAGEERIDVSVAAVCTGALILKQWIGGYGGVAVQRCDAPDVDDVTVLYGHLDLASIKRNVGAPLVAGEHLGNLGDGYSGETDGERKHLHLSVHRGSAIELRGYVQVKAQLASWIDPLRAQTR